MELFALMSSKMHACWLQYIGGRLKSDYQYSPGIVYNTFPWPELKVVSKAELQASGKKIRETRSIKHGASLADLYDPDLMPKPLRIAHLENDKIVEKLYRSKAIESASVG